jgi:hypothetical protein
MRLAILLAGCSISALAQSWDLPARASAWVSGESEKKLKIGFEERIRYEDRSGQAFGKDPDLSTGLVRNRFSLSYKPSSALKFAAMVQDSRTPGYGPRATASVRDTADLQEAYIELFPDRKTGFGMSAGRAMINYGEARLIGSPQWGNVARTWDHARVYYRFGGIRLELLAVSPVKVRMDDFNRPVAGDRIFGTYNTIALPRKVQADVYFLRHDQNRPGGFTGGSRLAETDRLRVNTFGGRLTGPLFLGAKYSLEGALQTGKIGAADHRAGAWFSGISRRWTVGAKPLDLSAEYKYASGADNPADTRRSGTFDQLYPANHDKFGHQDLFGWRNIHNVRSLATLGVTKQLAMNFMYSNSWLASVRDSLYSGPGKSIARSAAGTAGRHVGQEADVFATFKYGRLQFGGGYGRFFAGEFIRKTTPGVSPTYVYVFQSYTL